MNLCSCRCERSRLSACGPLLSFGLGAFIDVFLNALRAGSRPGGRVTFICGPK
jgi:hypothetical protein